MNWNQFFIYLSAVYILYYTCAILFDYLKIRRQGTVEPDEDEFFFSEEVVPQLILPEEEASEPIPQQNKPKNNTIVSLTSGLLESTGGVSIRELFDLAKIDAIEYSRGIPY